MIDMMDEMEKHTFGRTQIIIIIIIIIIK